MIRLTKAIFEQRTGGGCSNSDYELLQTTCCRRAVVWDAELDDIYCDPLDLTRVIRVWGQDAGPCPLCGAPAWDLEGLESAGDVPREWAWAMPGPGAG